MSDYQRMEKAIAFIAENVARQPSLDDIAAHVHLSPYHFQRTFQRWTGTTPKRLLQLLTLERSKQLLKESVSLLESSDTLGLSSSSRLHDHFVTLEAVTPGEFKSGGAGVAIHYGVGPSPFGDMFVAWTPRGICRAAFIDTDGESEALTELQADYPLATVERDNAGAGKRVSQIFTSGDEGAAPLKLAIAGTNFQLAVWRALLKIPEGVVVSYGQLAKAIGQPTASRAVGTAVGANPVAFLIPCHRVIQSTGVLGHYRWGPVRKRAICVWEQARREQC